MYQVSSTYPLHIMTIGFTGAIDEGEAIGENTNFA
jgi:hypothetical protein